MSFQILDKENNPIPLNRLDTEAAFFWKKEVHPKQYATPQDSMWSSNWFDIIGYNIHSPKENYTSGWNNVKCSMMQVQTAGYGMLSLEEASNRLKHTYIFLQPYFDLINYWQSLGYTPLQIKD